MVDRSDLEGLDAFALLDTEADRCKQFFESCTDEDWTQDTRCAGWRVRELLSHVDGIEVYHQACLDDEIAKVFEDGAKHGATDLHSFNDWIVRARADKPVAEVLESWKRGNANVRQGFRERGADGTLSSSVGPYPVDLMAFHIASEYATHADDMHVQIDPAEAAERTAWRAKVSRFALKETDKPVEVEQGGGRYVVRLGDNEAELDEADFVEAVTSRLPDDYPIAPELRDALVALA